jgi:hypothetical protein
MKKDLKNREDKDEVHKLMNIEKHFVRMINKGT